MEQLSEADRRNPSAALAFVVAFVGTALWFAATWRYGLDLSDEGFYWYGAQRVLRGEVPLRDFMSYDVGRYYWAAAFMHLAGDGVLGARLSAAAYQFLGTFAGLWVCLSVFCGRGVSRLVFACVVFAVLIVWSVPYYKAYDHATSMIIVAMVLAMLKVPTPRVWFAAGICLGLAAIMGRNHGVYGAVAVTLLVIVLFFRSIDRRAVLSLCAFFATGVVVGFSPTFVLMATADGFYAAFVHSLVKLFKTGETNIPLPVPWPWRSGWKWEGPLWTALRMSTGFGFVFLVAMPLVGLFALAYRRFDLNKERNRVLLAATACAIPYVHYAFARADLTHLALSIFPSLIVLFSLFADIRPWKTLTLGLGTLSASILTVASLQAFFAPLTHARLEQADVDGERLWVYPGVARKLELASKVLLAPSLGPATAGFLAIPNLQSLHAIYRTRMPVWEIYPLSAKNAELEVREIERLEKSPPGIVLLSDHGLDGDPRRTLKRMRPRMAAWFSSHYRLAGDGAEYGFSEIKVLAPQR